MENTLKTSVGGIKPPNKQNNKIETGAPEAPAPHKVRDFLSHCFNSNRLDLGVPYSLLPLSVAVLSQLLSSLMKNHFGLS